MVAVWKAWSGCGLLLAAGCAGGGDPGVSRCEAPRPQLCTMRYAPVCATLAGGGQATYSSGCNACADEAVVSYRDGRCEDGGA